MAKTRTAYICQNCEYKSLHWLGQCPECKSWNTFVETVQVGAKSALRIGKTLVSKPVRLSQVKKDKTERISSGLAEFDRVLGGGFVPGQVILIAGDPGIGKSTLLTQIAKEMFKKNILYICGEESIGQVKVRTERMGYEGKNLNVLSETSTEIICEAVEESSGCDLVIVDSVQSLTAGELTGIAGSVGQVRASTQQLTNLAKKLSIPLILVGHVTKEGTVAGPKVLEHIVDTVLYLEGDTQHLFRILKTTKNRFGPLSEVGVFEMTGEGMKEIKNPSEMFLSERLKQASGSCVTVVMEGFRPILFEIQALVSRTNFGYPRRTASGFSVNRLQVLAAILEKRCGLDLSNHDIYVNVAGGFRVDEYAADLAVCLAIASSFKDSPIGDKVAAFGECGLSGEVRRVSHLDKRIKEAKKLGYTKIISPESVKSVSKAVGEILK